MNFIDQILNQDCIQGMQSLPDGCVNTCVTSPPYYGLRDYGHDGQIGLEDTPDAYVQKIVEVFREVKRVLRDDGTLWLNIGDSYAAQRGGSHQPAETLAGGKSGKTQEGDIVNRDRFDGYNPTRNASAIGLKHKDLVGIPWRVAFALQADGWYLRQDIIWHKPNPMPESVTDRCTKAHEYIFLLSKSPRYYFDSDAIREDAKS
jgi:DNA modification methylase